MTTGYDSVYSPPRLSEVFPPAGGTGLSQAQVESIVKDLATLKDSFPSIAMADAEYSWPNSDGQVRTAYLDDGSILVAAVGATGFSELDAAATAQVDTFAAVAMADAAYTWPNPGPEVRTCYLADGTPLVAAVGATGFSPVVTPQTDEVAKITDADLGTAAPADADFAVTDTGQLAYVVGGMWTVTPPDNPEVVAVTDADIGTAAPMGMKEGVNPNTGDRYYVDDSGDIQKEAPPPTVTVTDGLTSTSTVDALSANQGSVIKALVDALGPIDDLTSTSTTAALSARQGQVLHAEFQQYQAVDRVQALSNFVDLEPELLGFREGHHPVLLMHDGVGPTLSLLTTSLPLVTHDAEPPFNLGNGTPIGIADDAVVIAWMDDTDSTIHIKTVRGDPNVPEIPDYASTTDYIVGQLARSPHPTDATTFPGIRIMRRTTAGTSNANDPMDAAEFANWEDTGAYVAPVVAATGIIDNLLSFSATDALSANQGRALDEALRSHTVFALTGDHAVDALSLGLDVAAAQQNQPIFITSADENTPLRLQTETGSFINHDVSPPTEQGAFSYMTVPYGSVIMLWWTNGDKTDSAFKTLRGDPITPEIPDYAATTDYGVGQLARSPHPVDPTTFPGTRIMRRTTAGTSGAAPMDATEFANWEDTGAYNAPVVPKTFEVSQLNQQDIQLDVYAGINNITDEQAFFIQPTHATPTFSIGGGDGVLMLDYTTTQGGDDTGGTMALEQFATYLVRKTDFGGGTFEYGVWKLGGSSSEADTGPMVDDASGGTTTVDGTYWSDKNLGLGEFMVMAPNGGNQNVRIGGPAANFWNHDSKPAVNVGVNTDIEIPSGSMVIIWQHPTEAETYHFKSFYGEPVATGVQDYVPGDTYTTGSFIGSPHPEDPLAFPGYRTLRATADNTPVGDPIMTVAEFQASWEDTGAYVPPSSTGTPHYATLADAIADAANYTAGELFTYDKETGTEESEFNVYRWSGGDSAWIVEPTFKPYRTTAEAYADTTSARTIDISQDPIVFITPSSGQSLTTRDIVVINSNTLLPSTNDPRDYYVVDTSLQGTEIDLGIFTGGSARAVHTDDGASAGPTSALSGFVLEFPFRWAEDPVNHVYEMNGQRITDGATKYSAAAAVATSWVDGADLVLPDWRGRAFMSLGALGVTGSVGQTFSDATAQNNLDFDFYGGGSGSGGNHGTQSASLWGGHDMSTGSGSRTNAVRRSGQDAYTRPNAVGLIACVRLAPPSATTLDLEVTNPNDAGVLTSNEDGTATFADNPVVLTGTLPAGGGATTLPIPATNNGRTLIDAHVQVEYTAGSNTFYDSYQDATNSFTTQFDPSGPTVLVTNRLGGWQSAVGWRAVCTYA